MLFTKDPIGATFLKYGLIALCENDTVKCRADGTF
jgi:hypothetical protein